MESLLFITKLLDIQDSNIKILDIINMDTHKEIIAKLDHPDTKCPHCLGQIAKYDFPKESKVLYLECAGYKTLIQFRKCRFCCKVCGKMAVAETSLVKRISKSQTNVNQKITKKLIEKVPMTAIAKSLSISTSTVIRKLKAFKTDLSFLPNHMAWDEYSYSFKKGKLASLHRTLHRTLIPERSSLTCMGGLK